MIDYMPSLYTIGYQGSDIDRFLTTLRSVGIETLADVREIPLSRKKGFSKTSLANALDDCGIEYLHFRDLGDPKPGRDAARSGRHDEFVKIYSKHLRSEPAQEALNSLLKVASEKITCMLCFERCATGCHRSIIADEAVRLGFNVYNLVADRSDKYSSNDFKIPGHRSYQGLPAAE